MKLIKEYKENLTSIINTLDESKIYDLAKLIFETNHHGKCIYFCGNGGSAGNANHIVNDLIYGARNANNFGYNTESLSANQSVLTCLANDVGYDNIFSEQINCKAKRGDLLICLSGSGNSKNIVNAIKLANTKEIKTVSIVGYDGGESKKISQFYIHTNINDMQISEDLQLIIFHIVMKLLKNERIKNE